MVNSFSFFLFGGLSKGVVYRTHEKSREFSEIMKGNSRLLLVITIHMLSD